MSTADQIGAQERQDALDREVDKYLKKGYRVTNRAPHEAQMIRPRKTHKLSSLILLILTLGLSLLVEAFLYGFNVGGERAVNLRVDGMGKVRAVRTKV